MRYVWCWILVAASVRTARAETFYHLDPGGLGMQTGIPNAGRYADPATSANPLDQLVTNGADTGHATFSHSNAGLDLVINFVRGGNGNASDTALEQTDIRFTPTRDLTYAITAQFSASANPTAFSVSLGAGDEVSYHGSGSVRQGQDTPGQTTYAAGTPQFDKVGSITGTLSPGNVYDFQVQEEIGDDYAATSTSRAFLALTPIPKPAALAGAVLLLAILRRGRPLP